MVSAPWKVVLERSIVRKHLPKKSSEDFNVLVLPGGSQVEQSPKCEGHG